MALRLAGTLLLGVALVLVPLLSIAAAAIAMWSCAVCDNDPHDYPAVVIALVSGVGLTYGIAALLKRLVRLQPPLW